MGRSQLLKDIVGGKEELENILLRLKIIVSDFDNSEINDWIKGELEGYDNTSNLPHYRIVTGVPKGHFLVNSQVHYKDSYVPVERLLDAEAVKNIKKVTVRDSIGTIYTFINRNNRSHYGKLIPTSYCHSISTHKIQVASMNIQVPINLISKIISIVRSKLVEVVMELEKEFENLDELDISSQIEERPSKIEKIIYNIEKIIFDDSIKVGDRNKFQDSTLGN